MSSLKYYSSLEYPQIHSVLPSPSAKSRVPYLRKRSRSPWLRQPLGSWHHQLCHRLDLQFIQNHVAPSHGPSARVLSPLFFPARSPLLPKPRGKREHPSLAVPTFAKATWFLTTPKSCGPQPSFFSLLCRYCNQGELPTSPISLAQSMATAI